MSIDLHIAPRIDENGEPRCSRKCPAYCDVGDYDCPCPRCEADIDCREAGEDYPCVPALRRQRDEARADLARLKCDSGAADITLSVVEAERDELQMKVQLLRNEIEHLIDRVQMARDCLACSDNWKTEQAENQAMRHLDAAIEEELHAD